MLRPSLAMKWTHALGAALLALCGACSEPQYNRVEDGGEPTGDAATRLGSEPEGELRDASHLRDASDLRDASVGPTDPEDAGEEDLDAGPSVTDGSVDVMLGKYAVRMRFYYTDQSGLVDSAQEMVALGTIEQAEGGPQLNFTHWCLDHAITVSPAGTVESRMREPRKYPGRIYAMQVDGDGFSTTGAPVIAGWNATSPAGCTPGAKIPAQDDQVWLSGKTCTCAANDSVVPLAQDDCRVNDLDDDGRPGYTVDWTGVAKATVDIARRDRSRLILGRFDRKNGRHIAQYAPSHEHNQLKLDCASGCTAVPEPILCRDKTLNTVLFEPLADGDYGCDAMEAKYDSGELFTSDKLVPVSDC